MKKVKTYLVKYSTATANKFFIVGAVNFKEAIDRAQRVLGNTEYVTTFGRTIELNESFKGKPRKF